MGNPSSFARSNNHYSSRVNRTTPSAPGAAQRPSLFFCDRVSAASDDETGCSLDACFLCKTRLRAGDDDIFMYRGNIPFCSEECRQEKIEIDETQERESKINSSLAAVIPSATKSKSQSHTMQARAVTAAVAG